MSVVSADLRRRYPQEFGWSFRVDQSVARCPKRDQVLSYYENDRDGEHSYSYRRMTCDDVYLGFYDLPLYHKRFHMTGQVALSPDGDRAIGQRHRPDSGYELVELPLRTRSLAGKVANFVRRSLKLTPRQIVRLPQQADAFDLGPDGQIAVAMGKAVHVYDRKHGLTPWKTFQDTIRDVQYLDDGTLAVLTRTQSVVDAPDFHLSNGTESHTLAYRQVDPQHYDRLVEIRCQGVTFLEGATSHDRERFLADCQWLEKERGGWKPHQKLGPDLVAVKEDTSPTLWTYDAAAGKAEPTVQLQAPTPGEMGGGPLDPLRELGMSPTRSHLVQLGAGQKACDHVPVWEASSGKLLVVLPHVREVALTPDSLRFTDLAGKPHEVPLEQAARVKDEPWYRQSLTAGLLDSQPVTTGHGVRQEGDRLRVGGQFLRIRARTV